MKLAIITGADGGMGTEITRAVATAGYKIIMACYRPEKAERVKDMLVHDTGNPYIEVLGIDLASLASVAAFAERMLKRGDTVSLLMNNAGTMETGRHITEDGLERTVSVNYVAPYLLTRKLIPLMEKGSRIVNMVSCTYAIGRLDFPDFFHLGKRGGFWRIPVYSNTKLALTLFTVNLANRVKEKGIVVNAADPGIVSTDIITMHMWFDPLTDILFRPLSALRQGAETAVHLLLDEDAGKRTGTLNASCRPKHLSGKYTRHVQMQELWNRRRRLWRSGYKSSKTDRTLVEKNLKNLLHYDNFKAFEAWISRFRFTRTMKSVAPVPGKKMLNHFGPLGLSYRLLLNGKFLSTLTRSFLIGLSFLMAFVKGT